MENGRNIYSTAFCLFLPEACKGQHRPWSDIYEEQKYEESSRCGELKQKKEWWSEVSEVLWGNFLCCYGQEYVSAVLNKCIQGSGAASWGHSVTQSEGGPADKSLGGSARPAPAAQGVTAEYTWPGSFRPSRDNCERLLPRLQPKLTKGIMCGGRSPHSKVDSLNVWLCYHGAVTMCVCVYSRVCI